MNSYDAFLQSKIPRFEACGVMPSQVHSRAFNWQGDVIRLSAQLGRFAGFEDCGLGKSIQQIEWCNQIIRSSRKPMRGLMLTPLSVAQQTIEEGKKLDTEITFVSEPSDKPGIQITNYQKLHKFVGVKYDFICLDESSILKSLDGKTRTLLLEQFTHIPYRSCWTATPSPNDVVELLQHAEFLGIKTAREARSEFFVHDSGNGAVDGYRLKGHAEQAFWEWVADWAIYIRRPSDLGYSDEGYILPELKISEEIVKSDFIPDGSLFPGLTKGVSGRSAARRHSLDARVELAAEILSTSSDQWLVWCDLNDEGRNLQSLLKEAYKGSGIESVLLEGSTPDEERMAKEQRWRQGTAKDFIGKTGMFGHGLNWQHCHNILYLGLSDSYEKWYQSVRRCYRFGQQYPVNVVIVTSEAEISVVDNIKRKEQNATQMAEGIVKAMREKQMRLVHEQGREEREVVQVSTGRKESGDRWAMINGDCVRAIRDVASDSVGFCIFSPPFAKLYCYSDQAADMGNSANDGGFFMHFGYLIPELLRVTMPGRLCAVHCQDLTTSKASDGYIGRRRFSDQIADAFESHGWICASRVTINKNPQALKNGTKVVTPTGWQAIDSLRVDDYVIGSDGLPTRVLGVWPHWQKQMYRVTFSDGASIECDGQHLWNVRMHGTKYRTTLDQWSTKRTDELYGNLHSPSGKIRYEVPLTAPVEYYGSTLPIDPYILGVIIGDGGISQRATVDVMMEPEILEHMNLPQGCFARRIPYGDRANGAVGRFHIQHTDWHVNPILDGLRTLGLQGKRAWEKAIPPVYKIASSRDRLALLQGLMDTDGTCKKAGTAHFATVSRELADDVVALVESLGGLARIAIEHPTYKYKGELRNSRERYVVTIRVTECPFRLRRKADRWSFPKGKASRRDIRRQIISIEPTTIEDCTCITVENEDGLFLTERYLVTHNSQAIRTKAKTLMFVQKNKDSSWSWPALADYLMVFQKPGENPEPVLTDITNEEWITLAHPVWMEIDEGDTLNARSAREEKDEAHLCPLQLGTIRNAVRLWSNRNDLVLSPFAGIGSEGYVSLQQERRFIGFELKESYFNQAVRNLQSVAHQELLFKSEAVNG